MVAMVATMQKTRTNSYNEEGLRAKIAVPRRVLRIPCHKHHTTMQEALLLVVVVVVVVRIAWYSRVAHVAIRGVCAGFSRRWTS
jgi:hypothetical protein